MAEGGYDMPGENENTGLDWDIDHDDDDDEEEVDTTTPFQPGAASTPYHGWEAHEMHKMPPEQSGLDDEGRPLIDDAFMNEAMEKASRIDKAIDWLKKRFPKIDLEGLGPIGFGKKKGNQTKIVSFGPRGGETPIFRQDGSGLLKGFVDTHKGALGPSAEEIIVEDRTSIREDEQRLKEAQRLEKTLNETAAKQQRAVQETQAKKDQLEQINQRLANMETEGGTLIERQNEIDRLNREKAKTERDIKEAEKKNKEYAKTKRDQEKATREVERLQRKLADENQKQTLSKLG